MEVKELITGKKYKCSCFKYENVTLESIDVVFPGQGASVTVKYRNNFYSVGASNLFPTDKRHPLEPYKVGPVYLSREEMEEICNSEKYIVSGCKIYQINFSAAQNDFTYQCIYTTMDNLTRRGRFYTMDGATVNRLLGFDLLRVPA